MNEFWDFLVYFKRQQDQERRSKRSKSKFFPDNMDASSWIKDPRYHANQFKSG